MNIQSQYCFNSKPIPYSKIVYDQLIDADDEDCNIPDEYSVKNGRPGIRNYCYNNICYENEEEDYGQYNEYPRTFTFNGHHLPQEERKKLTHGLKNYKDIKSSVLYTSQSHKKSKSRSGSKSKKERLNQQKAAREEKQFAQCTFTPKTNYYYRPPYRNFKEFTNFQEEFLEKKQAKIQKIKQQISEMESANFTGRPSIDKKSRRMSEIAESNYVRNSDSATKPKQKLPYHERLYNIPKRKQETNGQEHTFTPKILNKSKQIQRNEKVQNLLYEDAQRRINQQNFIQTQAYQRQSLMKKYPQKQIQNNNKLLCNKIRAEFLQLLQVQTQNEANKNDKISPILAVTILSELFNVQLDPNKNEELCFKVINYLISYDYDENSGYVQINRLWDFVKAIIIGVDGYQAGVTQFTEEMMERIHQELGYFYSQRLLKWPSRYEEQIESQYKPELSQKTNRLAQSYRTKRIEKINEFLQSAKGEKKAHSKEKQQSFQEKEKEQNEIKENKKPERILKLQDRLILDSIRHKTQLEKKKKQKQQQSLKQCTFKPIIHEKPFQKPSVRRMKSKQSIKSKQREGSSSKAQQKPIKTQIRYAEEKMVSKQENIEKVQQVVNKIKAIQNKIPMPNKILKKKRTESEVIPAQNEKKHISTSAQKKIPQNDNKEQNLSNIKDVDKTILRYSLARKMKNIQTSAKQRGYNAKSANWLKEIQYQKKQILGELSNFLGYTGRNSSREKYISQPE